MLGENNLV